MTAENFKLEHTEIRTYKTIELENSVQTRNHSDNHLEMQKGENFAGSMYSRDRIYAREHRRFSESEKESKD
jgi:hypothetical protein